MKYLFVGDPHATVDSLDECRRLIEYVTKVARDNYVHNVVLLGDLYHTHAVMRVEVMNFWRWAFENINSTAHVIALVGNHDMPGNESSNAHALLAHVDRDGVSVIDNMRGESGIIYLPYMADQKEFVHLAKAAGEQGANLLVCHQSFLGFKYENGHVIEDGIDLAALPFKRIISGHIHSPQKGEKLWYIGAPRWRTAADANTERHIWVLDIDSDGLIKSEQSFPTNTVCSELVCLEDRPENPLPKDLVFHNYARVMIDIHGPQDWIEQRKRLYPLAHRIRTFRTDNRAIRVKESEGVENALQSYLGEYIPKNGTPKEVLAQMVKERVYGAG